MVEAGTDRSVPAFTTSSIWPARLRLNGLITRTPGRNLYTLTPDGLAFAIFYAKVCNRLLRPLMAITQPQARPSSPPVIAAAMRIIDRHIDNRLADARMLTRSQHRNSRQLSKT